MGKPYFSLRLKDPQAIYFSNETIPCILELRTNKPLRDPLIRIIFKGRSSSYTNAKIIHYQKLFDIEQVIKRTDIVPKKTFEIEFNVEAKKGMEIPSSFSREGIDGGQVEYMVEGILETDGFLSRKEKATHILDVPLVAKLNIADPVLQRPKETSVIWPRIDEEVNQCRLHALIRSSGWMRGKTIPINISWKQPDRFINVKQIEFALIRQETIASSKDNPPDMTLKLPDKPIVRVVKDVKLEHDTKNQAMLLNKTFEIDIPSHITPTIHGDIGKVVQVDYKLRVTAFLPEMGPYNQDREVSVNLDIIIGTVFESASFDFTQELERLSISSRHASNSSMDIYFKQPQPPVHHNPPPPPPPHPVERELTQQPGMAGGFINPNAYPLRNNTTCYVPNQMSPINTNLQSSLPPQPPVINTTGYPPNTHTNYSPSSSSSPPPPPSSSSSTSGNKTIQEGFSPDKNLGYKKSILTQIYPPPIEDETILPMEINEDVKVQEINRTIEQNIYPPPLKESPDAFEMASPACFMHQFDNDFLFYSNDSGIQQSDENTTLSSKNSYRNNDKTQH